MWNDDIHAELCSHDAIELGGVAYAQLGDTAWSSLEELGVRTGENSLGVTTKRKSHRILQFVLFVTQKLAKFWPSLLKQRTFSILLYMG